MIIYGICALVGTALGAGGVILYEKLTDEQKKKIKEIENQKEMHKKEMELINLKASTEKQRLDAEIQNTELRVRLLELRVKEEKLLYELAEYQRKKGYV